MNKILTASRLASSKSEGGRFTYVVGLLVQAINIEVGTVRVREMPHVDILMQWKHLEQFKRCFKEFHFTF